MTNKGRKISVAEYLSQQIFLCGKSQKEIAEAVGYDKPNIITMFKQGKTKLPINKVPAFAKVLGVDPVHLLRLTMSEYMPDTWESIEAMIGGTTISQSERAIIDIVRAEGGGQDVAPENDEDRNELAALVAKWKDRAESLAKAAEHRTEID